jgi:hypothetical protein
MKRSIALVCTVALLAGADAAVAGGSHGGRFHSGGSVVGHIGASTGGHFHPGSGHRPFFHHRGRVIVGSTIFLGGVGYPYYYAPPPVYAAPPAYAEEPITYIEQSPPAQSPSAQPQVYYYCPDSRAYYPDVTTCPSAWLKVVP